MMPHDVDSILGRNSGLLKTRSAFRSERIAKYNRLLEIEQELVASAQYYWK